MSEHCSHDRRQEGQQPEGVHLARESAPELPSNCLWCYLVRGRDRQLNVKGPAGLPWPDAAMAARVVGFGKE